MFVRGKSDVAVLSESSSKKVFGSASIWVIDMFLHGSPIYLIINTLTSKKVVDVRIFLYLCM